MADHNLHTNRKYLCYNYLRLKCIKHMRSFFFLSAISLEHLNCKYKQFPEGFMLGTSSSAYQIEGAWDADGMVYFKNINCTCNVFLRS